MARAGAACRAITGVLAVALSVTPLRAQAPPRPLAALVTGLHLTGAGAQDWLGRLGVASGQPVHERLLAVAATGEVLKALDGRETSVVVTPDFDGELVREGAGIVLVHNHPGSTSLSQQDLGQLDKAGVIAVVAIGHDGSVYAASKASSAAATRPCGPECYAKARTEVSAALRLELPRMATNAATVSTFSTHLTMLALAKAGYFEYFASMSTNQRAIFEAHVVAFGRVIASARAVLDK